MRLYSQYFAYRRFRFSSHFASHNNQTYRHCYAFSFPQSEIGVLNCACICMHMYVCHRAPLAANWFQSTSTSTSTKRDNALIKTIFCFTFHSVLHALAHGLFALANWRLQRILNLSTGYTYTTTTTMDDKNGIRESVFCCHRNWNRNIVKCRMQFWINENIFSASVMANETTMATSNKHRKIRWKWKSAKYTLDCCGLIQPSSMTFNFCISIDSICAVAYRNRCQRHDDNYTKSVWNSNLNSQNQMRYVSDCSLDFFANTQKPKEKLNADAIYFAVRCVRCVSLPKHTNFSSHSKWEEEEEVKWIKIVYGILFVDVPIGIVKHNEMFCHRDSTVHYFTCHVQCRIGK